MPILKVSPTQQQLYDTLLLEIRDKATQIRELVQEKEALERLLMKHRQHDDAIGQTDVTRKNSLKRVLVENSILRSLQHSKKPIRAKALFKVARDVVPNLPDSTFRSYLHRMSARGLIEHSSQGMWQATPVKETKSATPQQA